jgi:hypothetical protein
MTSSASAQTGWGSALSFDGVDDYVSVPVGPWFGQEFTIETWVYPRAHTPYARIISFTTEGSLNGLANSVSFCMSDADTGKPSLHIFNGAGGDSWLISPQALPLTQWSHVAVTLKAGNAVLYLNGQAVTNGPVTANPVTRTVNYIGRSTWTGSPPDPNLNARLDDLRIWDVARTAEEIEQNLGRPLSGQEPGLMAYWKFDEGTGATALDATANAANATLINGPEWLNDPPPLAPSGWGNALSFDGYDDRVQVTDFTGFPTTQVTVEFWMRSANATKAGTPFSYATAGVENALLLFDYRNFEIQVAGHASGQSGVSANDGQWHHVALTWSSSSGDCRLYVDGLFRFQKLLAKGAVLNTTGYLVLGQEQDSRGGGFDTAQAFLGQMDEVRIWNTVRSQQEIQASMTHPLTGSESGLAAYYRFDEGGGIRAYDTTPSHNDGALYHRPFRVPCTLPPQPAITLFGANPMIHPYHVPFTDPDATAGAGAASISAGGMGNLALKPNGTVVGWGDPIWNNYGQWIIPSAATNVVAIAAGDDTCVALRGDSSVITWGYRTHSLASGAVAVAGGYYHSLALKTNGAVIAWGSDYYVTNIPSGARSDVVAIAAGAHHNLALKINGTVYGWGHNGAGEATGIPTQGDPIQGIEDDAAGTVKVANQTLTSVVAIAAGSAHSLALRADGSVVGWGAAAASFLAVPQSAKSGVVAIAACEKFSMALKADGSVVAWGDSDWGVTNVPASATSDVIAIGAGRAHCLALKADGSLVAWGRQSKAPLIERTLLPGLTTKGSVNVDVPGAYTLTYSVTNAFGVANAVNREVVVAPDTTPPTLPHAVTVTASSANCQAMLTPITATDASDPAPTVTCVPPVGSVLPVGRNYVDCIAADASGNSRTGAVQVFVLRPDQRLAPAGEIWAPRLTVADTISVASSADGSRLVAADYRGQIYTSADSGNTWTPRESNRGWSSVASSADGLKLIAADFRNGRIYTSTDAGATWTPRESNRYWRSVASSADGTKLVAADESPGLIYTSTDSGTNWTATSAPSALWYCVASSADGTRLFAADGAYGGLFASTDSGLTWSLHWVDALFVSVACSADGTKVVAGEDGGRIWTSSDSGVTWTPTGDHGSWWSVASSENGTRLFAADPGELGWEGYSNGKMCSSSDSGSTWTSSSTSTDWWSVACSADGSRLVAGTYDGQLYVSAPTLVPPPPPVTFAGAHDLAVDLAGLNGSVATFSVTSTTTNDCEPVLPVLCTPPSGSTFPAGKNVVTCLAVDVFGFTNTVTFIVDVRGLLPPTDIALSNSALSENEPSGTTVGTFSVTDPEPGDRHRLTLVTGAGDADNGSFTIAGNTLRTAAILHYEHKSSYRIRVRAMDSGDFSVERSFTITVGNRNDAPVLDVVKVPELRAAGIGAGVPAGAVGTPISDLVDIGGRLSNVTDDDAGAATGVAIIEADGSHGQWLYTLDDGTNWNLLGAPSESSARLLSAAAGTRLYFQPNTNVAGLVPGALAFRAWDQTVGSNGGTADTRSNGWSTAFSAAVNVLDQSVGWGYALSLDGVDDYLTLPAGPWFGDVFTIETWVYPRAHTKYARIVSFTTDGSNNGLPNSVSLCTSFETTGRPSLHIFSNSGADTALVTPTPLPLNQWAHVAVTLQAGTAILYINGRAVTNGPVTANPANRTINYIGRSTWTGSPPDPNLNAMLDEVRIWNVARTPSEIASGFLTTLSGNEPGLAAYYRFDEGSGLRANDGSTNHIEGLLAGSPGWVRSTVPLSLTPVDRIEEGTGTRQVQGYWPGGIAGNASQTVSNLVVSGLSVDVQPPSGKPGVLFTNQGAAGPNGGSHYGSGGNGTAGGAGGTVAVALDAKGINLKTVGTNAHAVSAQSLGGGGGRGGEGWGVITGAGIGGRGASGGRGGSVTVNSSADLATSSGNSHGIFALSQAGKGGNGGGGTIYLGIGYSVGGDAGRGGDGGAVTVTGSGQITNTSHNSDGILAVSQAGKGGNGGSGSSIGNGGDGGAGGVGGNVTVSGSWTITTRGTNSPGISANSLGGGGGTSASGGWIGGGSGTGGASGSGGRVKVDFGPGIRGDGGRIETFGQDSHGILAQSVGGFAGGGADGGSIFFSAGGDGGSAGNGGDVSLANRGLVSTHGQGAHALFAESVGGGGGSSGSARGIFGGNAGTAKAGGDGGYVSLFNSGEARTDGFNARGLFAQSVGGSGGNAGYTAGLFASIGGSGGLGGDGHGVSVDNTGLISTVGSDSSAIFAQSAGGGGGAGGGSGSVGAFVSVAVGGTGGGGGDGGWVGVKSGTNSIATQGTNSHGILAQSVGGGGGKGGFALSISGGLGGSESIGVGGQGGGGGSAGRVSVTSGSTVSTHGSNSHGIFAQSVGGGGGEGGFGIAISGSDTYAGAVGLGGAGGKGGTASFVSVDNTGSITTTGERSYGVLAQSLGGGGGDGEFGIGVSGAGSVTLPASVGGTGGDGGGSGMVILNNRNSVTTAGGRAHGLFAQSVGGGGGSGGFSVTASGSGTFAGGFSMGGSGGKGGQGGEVQVANTAKINTAGERAYGILAQSVGGGGGDGGFSVGVAGSGTAAVAASVGGSGGDGGNGSMVQVENPGKISTLGSNAHGIFAQSVGGGGGAGGFSIAGSGSGTFGGSFSLGGSGGAGGSGDRVTVNSSGEISTAGQRSYGILAQSVGGGGGDGDFSVAGAFSAKNSGVALPVSIGGSGGAAGNGAMVNLDSGSDVTTLGDDSHGIFAQSTGGGGGSGGFSISAALSGGYALGASVGGSGDNGGSGSTVNVANRGEIHTSGTHAYGILAQSVGGGGGDGGFSVSGSLSKSPAVQFSMGGLGAGGGKGGSVTLTNSGRITTEGELAYGVLAQSVGGGGGSGGFSVAAALSGGAKYKLGGGAAAVGGEGGLGADSDAVTVRNAAGVETLGTGSHAIFAQSVGGGGGAGGFGAALAGGFGNGGRLAVGIGGEGGSGGDASQVVVRSTGTNIATHGVAAYGVFAQSVGGGGGDGGAGLAASFGTQSNAANLSLAIGRSGGQGGRGGAVAVENASAVETDGVVSHGIAAQSIGGGGGNGGFSAAGALSTSSNAWQASVSVGGWGGDGGSADNVNVTNSGAITTRSAVTGEIPAFGTNLATQVPGIPVGSAGILAQSIGGGGGNGGVAFAGTFAGTEAKNFSAAIGGGGGNGNFAGQVRVENSGAIDTAGKNSHGILAQSIGGGGGNGGLSMALTLGVDAGNKAGINVDLSLGGNGGRGAVGGEVSAVNRAGITTRGEESAGILAQSIGGGGGNGGASIAANVKLNTAAKSGTNYIMKVAVGGEGGSGDRGAAVSVDNQGAIETMGTASHGIHAQSIGGGGGQGGGTKMLSLDLPVTRAAWTGFFNNWKTNPFTNTFKYNGIKLDVSVGGAGGDAGHGDTVSINNEGTIRTSGDRSSGIRAQSIGGGGGDGGGSIQNPIFGVLDLLSIGMNPRGLGQFDPRTMLTSWKFSVGGNGGSFGNGGAASVTNCGTIDTSGFESHGIYAQSVGGGGGEAQLFSEGAGEGGKASIGLMGQVGIGGAGGAAGDGGKVSVDNDADIHTRGDNAHGIFAQSVGGGGGVAGNVGRGLGIQGAINQLAPELNETTKKVIDKTVDQLGLGVAIGQNAGSAGNGGSVTVANAGNILTEGIGAYGLLAQSVGGGGGVAGGLGNWDVPYVLQFKGSVGGVGDGGKVDVSQIGKITTMGDYAHGIFAQSAGGTNGSGGARGQGGEVSVTVAGDIIAHGANADGIFAQSSGINGGSNVFVQVLSGKVQGGSGSGVGIRIEGGATNLLINHGTIASAKGAAGLAIAAGGASKPPMRFYRVKAASSETNTVPPRISISRNSAGQTVLQFAWVTNQSYSVDYTSDLNDGVWMPVPAPVFTFPKPGTAQWTDDDRFSTGNETVENYGTVLGSVDLGSGLNVFNNHRGATLDLGLGCLDLGLGGVFNNFGRVTGSGQIVGNVFNQGSFDVGHSPGRLTIDGSLNLTASANLSFELAGRQQGTTYDYIHVNGSVSFLGALSLSLEGNFRPTSADIFTLMDFSGSSGLFDNILKGDRLWTSDHLGSFQVNSTTTSLRISGFESPDSDGDGMNDYDESLVGTDRLDRSSVLHITSLTRNKAGHLVLQWTAVNNRNYAIEYTSDLGAGNWKEVDSPVCTRPAAGLSQWVDDGSSTGGQGATLRYYRIRLRLN